MRVDSLSRRSAAEFVGTALLLATVVGSGIMADTLSGGNVGLALLCNALATGAGLYALIQLFGTVSGAHFNPVVTLADARTGGLAWSDVPAYVSAQVCGGVFGVGVANLMFQRAVFSIATHVRTGVAQWGSEFVATFGLIGVILAVSRRNPTAVPTAVAAYIVSAYWFTASTSFANPAVTLARALSDSFAGIRPADVPGFVAAQLAGAAAAVAFFGWLVPVAAPLRRVAGDV